MSEITDPAAGIVAEAAPLVKKTCTKCGVEKALEAFDRKKEGKLGRASWCKTCVRDYNRAHVQRPEVRERKRARKRQPEYNAWKRAYAQRPENKEKLRAYRQRPKYREWKRAYQQRPEYKKWERAYRQRPESKEWKRDYLRSYVRDRYRTDRAFKLMWNLRRRVRHALKGTCKSARTLELLGCTVEELRVHLEAQFKPGMTWENQGRYGWHVDHIRPCASFDMSDPEQQRACFHYTNLQPLWAKENMSKGAKLLDSSPKA